MQSLASGPIFRRVFAPLLGCFLSATICLAQPPPPGEEATPKPVTADVVDFNKLLPILPPPPEQWRASEPEGSNDDMGEAQIASVHRDYSKGDAEDGPITSISILDSAASPEYVGLTTSGWTQTETTAEGYTKPLTIDGSPGFEIFENEGKRGSLWLLVAKRYFLQIETTGQEANALHEWLKRIDLKKLAAIK